MKLNILRVYYIAEDYHLFEPI